MASRPLTILVAALLLAAVSAVARAGECIGDERVNVLEDYRRYFGATEPPKPVGIAVLTDADDTTGSAQGEYADFRLCTR